MITIIILICNEGIVFILTFFEISLLFSSTLKPQRHLFWNVQGILNNHQLKLVVLNCGLKVTPTADLTAVDSLCLRH